MGYCDREYAKLTHHSYDAFTSGKRAREEEDDTENFCKRSRTKAVEMALTQASLEEKIQALKGSLAAKQGEIRYLGDKMEEQDIIIQKMEQVIEKKERVINAKDKTIEEKDIIITHKESVIESFQSAAKKRRNELSDANGYTPEARGGASKRK